MNDILHDMKRCFSFFTGSNKSEQSDIEVSKAKHARVASVTTILQTADGSTQTEHAVPTHSVQDASLPAADISESTEPQSAVDIVLEQVPALGSDTAVESGEETESSQQPDSTLSAVDAVLADGQLVAKLSPTALEELRSASNAHRPVNIDHLLDQDAIEDSGWYFDGEDDQDYTVGQPRMVKATEGIKESPAILLSAELSKKLQSSVFALREVELSERSITQKKEIIAKYLDDVHIARMRNRTRHAQASTIPHWHRTPEDHRVLSALEKEEQILSAWTEDGNQTMAGLDDLALRTYKWAFDLQREATAILDGVLTRCCLIVPPTNETPEDEEIAAYAEAHTFPANGTQDFQDPGETLDMQEWLQSNQNQPQPEERPSTDEPHALRNYLERQYYRARTAYREADDAFEGREQAYHQAKGEWEWLTANEQDPGETRSELDRRILLYNANLTRDLAAAEDELERTKVEAREAGVALQDRDQESNFADDVQDGYRTSLEEALMAVPSKPRVFAWMDGLIDGENVADDDVLAANEIELEDWDAKTVGISESGSCVAEGKEAKRIAKWAAICEAVRNDLEGVTGLDDGGDEEIAGDQEMEYHREDSESSL